MSNKAGNLAKQILPIAAAAGLGVIAGAISDSASAQSDPQCPAVGEPASVDGESIIVRSEPIYENGEVVACDITERAELYLPAPSVQDLPKVRGLAAPLASHAYLAEQFCNIEVAGHEQAHIEMWDLHHHQRYTFDGHYVFVKFDGIGPLAGRKSVQWWTDFFWETESSSWTGSTAGSTIPTASRAFADFDSGPYYAEVLTTCETRPDGSSYGWSEANYNRPIAFSVCGPGNIGCWHTHARIYGGAPPDW